MLIQGWGSVTAVHDQRMEDDILVLTSKQIHTHTHTHTYIHTYSIGTPFNRAFQSQ